MLADNILYLKKKQPVLYEVLKKREENPQATQVILEETKNNLKTLKIKKDDKTVYLHSKYDPEREAELIIDELEKREKIGTDTHVIFYGLGLGYHLDAFFRRFPQIEFSIYEPSIDVLIHYLNQKPIKCLPISQLISLQCECDRNGMDSFFKAMITGEKKDNIICELPPYQKVFKEEYNAFLNQFREAITVMRNSIQANYAYKQRWILNSVINFKEVLTTPNILMENRGVFAEKTAIMVSAGPSLDYEIENLRQIKEKKLAFIFAVGSALNTLLHHKIYPDAMCTYDPLEENQVAFKKANELQITTIPVIFGSSVGFESLQKYHGPKYHMITNQDTVSNYFLKTNNDQPLASVSDASSIAVVTLELLYKLGFKEVILVGQNLAYLDKKRYAEGIDYQEIVNKDCEKNLIKTIDVCGKEILTNQGFNIMRLQIESYIRNFDLTVFNTTVGGVNIEGTKYISLEKLINKRLNKTVIIDGDEFNKIIQTDLYDQSYIRNRHLLMSNAYEIYEDLLSNLRRQLRITSELLANKNVKQASFAYSKLDQVLVELEANDYAKTFALPMIRVEHELVSTNIQRVKKEKNEQKRYKELLGYLNTFISLLYSQKNLNQQIMDALKERIDTAFNEKKNADFG